MTKDVPYFASLCSSYELGEDEEATDILQALTDVQYPEALRWEDSYIDPTDPAECKVVKSTSVPDSPSRGTSRSVFEIEANDQGEDISFHVHSYAQADHYSEVISLHNLFVSAQGVFA